MVGDELRERIVSGALEPGEHLVERRLAVELGVSRVPVREALRDLEREGFVEDRPRRGLVVRRLSQSDIDELFDIRAALEAVMVRRLVQRVDSGGLERLQAVLDAAQAAVEKGDLDAAVQANARFHEVMLAASASPLLATIMQPIAGRMRWLLRQHTDARAIHAEHAAILTAIRERNEDRAAQLCEQHIESSRAHLEAHR
jgi:DNA-binding GntR family transcriptional regulator